MPDPFITLALYWLTDQVGLVSIPGMDEYPHYNIKVVNMSMGGTTHTHCQALFMWLLSWRVVLVVSAGNDGSSYMYPAASERFLSDWFKVWRQDVALVTAGFTKEGQRYGSYYDPEIHNYNWVDVSAPAHQILVLQPNSETGYSVASGTSCAAPITSALAALMFAEHPYLSSWNIHDAIKTFTRNDPPLQDDRIPERIDYELALSLGMGNP